MFYKCHNCGHGTTGLCTNAPRTYYNDHMFLCAREAADGLLKHMHALMLSCQLPNWGYGHFNPKYKLKGTLGLRDSHLVVNDGQGGGEEIWPIRFAYLLYRYGLLLILVHPNKSHRLPERERERARERERERATHILHCRLSRPILASYVFFSCS